MPFLSNKTNHVSFLCHSSSNNMVSASPEYIAWLVFGMWGQQRDIVTLLPLNQMAIVSFISGASQKLGHLEHMTNKRVTLQKLLFTYYTCTYINYNQSEPLPYKGKFKNNLGWNVGKNSSCSKTQKEEHHTLRPLYLSSSLFSSWSSYASLVLSEKAKWNYLYEWVKLCWHSMVQTMHGD